MPYSPRCFSPEKYSADSRRVLLGTVPVLMQLPPGLGARSMTATRLPKYAACAPAFSPAGPQPMTIRSNWSFWDMERLTHEREMGSGEVTTGIAVDAVLRAKRNQRVTGACNCRKPAWARRAVWIYCFA